MRLPRISTPASTAAIATLCHRWPKIIVCDRLTSLIAVLRGDHVEFVLQHLKLVVAEGLVSYEMLREFGRRTFEEGRHHLAQRAGARLGARDSRLVDEGASVLARHDVILVGEDTQKRQHGVVGHRIAVLE